MREEALVLSLLVFSGLVIVCSLLALRFKKQELAHKERMSALEKGVAMVPEGREPAPWSPRVYLLRGLMWTFTGAALGVALLGVTSTSSYRPESPERLAIRAQVVSNRLNIPTLEARDVVMREEAAAAGQRDGPPPTIALFGLIPLGVGVAYLIFYRTGDERNTA